MLNCETNTPEMEQRIRTQFTEFNSAANPQIDFEHGQWWVTDLKTGAQWSVNDAAGDDFDFEQVSEGDE